VSDENTQQTASAAPAPAPVSAPAPVAEQRPEREGREGRGDRGGRGGRGGPGGDRGRRGPRRSGPPDDGKRDDLMEKTIFINRSAKVVKGGRRFSFSALVVTGDKTGKVGIGLGKGREVIDAIRKGGESARAAMVPVSLNNGTIPHEVISEYGGARVLLRPASPGTGLICGKTVRAVVESAGVRDVLSKSLGSKNPANVAKATLSALLQLRRREAIYKSRGLALRARAEAPSSPVLS
jgi:small subunit ribosomal protein S5